MKTKEKKQYQLRQPRFFSEDVRRQIVQDIEQCKCSVVQACREFSVSPTSIYRWMGLYGRYLQNNKRMIVENKSENYRTKELEARIKELEAALGRKQMELDFKSKMLEIIEEEYKIDIKKKHSTSPLRGSAPTKDSDTPIP